MTTYFITRHQGAVDWARAQGIVAQAVSHFDPNQTQAGDHVLGTLPVHLAAEVCARGGRYFHLTINLPPEVRGQDLGADDMVYYGARLEEFVIEGIEQDG